jgi:DNA modification methylase
MTKSNAIKWAPDNFELQMNTVWSFPDRGKWATHDSKYRGNWSPYVPRNIILRYSKERDLVLDQFVGGGTTLIESKLLNRDAIGVDINPESVALTKQKCNFEYEYESDSDIKVVNGDARNLDFILENSIDLICTHPPYSNIINYSDNIKDDLSLLNYTDFLKEMNKVAIESYRVLKKNKFCAILMGDTRKNGHIVPLSFEVMKIYESAGFKLKEIVIKEQHNCKTTGFWKTNSIKYNFLLIAHEYLFIFHK